MIQMLRTHQKKSNSKKYGNIVSSNFSLSIFNLVCICFSGFINAAKQKQKGLAGFGEFSLWQVCATAATVAVISVLLCVCVCARGWMSGQSGRGQYHHSSGTSTPTGRNSRVGERKERKKGKRRGSWSRAVMGNFVPLWDVEPGVHN